MPTAKRQRSAKSKKPEIPKVTGGLFDDLQTAEDDDKFLKIHVYGRSGTGKTTFWSSFPKPILAIVCSGSRNPGELKSVPIKERKNVFKHVLDNSTEIGQLCKEQQETGRFKTVVLDHITGLQEHILAEILGLDEIPTQLGWGTAQMQDYGQRSIQLKNILRELLSLRCNIVTVAQETDSSEEQVNPDIISPYVDSSMSKSVRAWFNPSCDYIVQTLKQPKMKVIERKIGDKTKTKLVREEGKVNYCIRIGSDDVYTTKFRIPGGVKENIMVDPTYDKIVSLLKGE